jgi:TRAP-type C4-dicarboxylate transport system permease small subunit
MMGLTTTSVVMRRLANNPLEGDYESITLLFVFVVFFGLAYAQSRNQHISIVFVHDRIPPKYRHYVDIFLLALSAGLFITITVLSSINTSWAFDMGDTILGAIQVKTWPARMAVPIGSGLLSIRLIMQLFRLVKRRDETIEDHA